MSEKMPQMPKQESSNTKIVGNPFEYVQDIIPKAWESFMDSFKGIGDTIKQAFGLDNLKKGGSGPAQDAFKNGVK